jgi:hypothetical protein
MYFASFAFLPEKPCPTGTLVKRLSWMLINVGVSPNRLHHPTSGTIRSSRRQFRRFRRRCQDTRQRPPHWRLSSNALVGSAERQSQILYQVKTLSPHHRFVTAFHSPHEVAETGLRGCPPEKKAAKAHSLRFNRPLSPVRFWGTIAELRRFSAVFPGLSPGFLYVPDCVAERVGFEADFERQLKDLLRHGQHSKRT